MCSVRFGSVDVALRFECAFVDVFEISIDGSIHCRSRRGFYVAISGVLGIASTFTHSFLPSGCTDILHNIAVWKIYTNDKICTTRHAHVIESVNWKFCPAN